MQLLPICKAFHLNKFSCFWRQSLLFTFYSKYNDYKYAESDGVNLYMISVQLRKVYKCQRNKDKHFHIPFVMDNYWCRALIRVTSRIRRLIFFQFESRCPTKADMIFGVWAGLPGSLLSAGFPPSPERDHQIPRGQRDCSDSCSLYLMLNTLPS